MSITDLENDLKIPSPAQSDSNFGHHVSTKFIGEEETIQTMNVLEKYDIHVLEYIKYCMTKYHHEVFLVITERRANYIKKYRLEHNNKLKKTHQQSSSYLENHMRRRKLNALYDNGEDYDESYFNNDDQNDNNNDVSELDYHLSRDADDTANLSEALRVISKGIDKISVLIKQKEKEKQEVEYQKLVQNIIHISLCLLLFVFAMLALFVIVIMNTFSRQSIQSI
jgi:small-conductance mechanosensitive channel